MTGKEERSMSPQTQATTTDHYVYPTEVLEFAAKHNVLRGLEPLRQATMRLFPTGTLRVTFEPDPEDAELDSIVFELRVGVADEPDYLDARRRWEDEFFRCYPRPYTNKEPTLSLRTEK
jgi:hypothetical protein